MTGVNALLQEVVARELPRDRGWPAPGHPLAGRALRVIERANDIGFRVVAGFSLFFVLFVASVASVAGLDLEPTGSILVDMLLVGVLLVGLGLLGCVGLLGSLAKLLRARRFVTAGATVGERRTMWMLDAAGLIGGVLLVAFVPRALGGAGEWADWLLLAFGAVMVAGALRD